MDPNKQELLRQVVSLVRDDLQGGGLPPSGAVTQQQRRQQALVKMLQTGDDPIKWIAAKELGQIGDLQAAQALEPLTLSANRDVSVGARDAIRRIVERQTRSAPPPPPVGPRAALPPPPPRPDAPRRAVPPPPPPMAVDAPLVEAHMGRSRDDRMTKGQDLPVPPTEARLGEMHGEAPTALAGMGLALGALPALAAMADTLPEVPAMAPPSTEAPDLPTRADVPGSVVDYSALGIPQVEG